MEQVRRAVRQALELSQENLQETRRSVLDLRAAPLEGRNLPEALSRLSEDISSREGLPVKFRSVGGPRPLTTRIETGLFRVAQEALTNVVRHSGASEALLRLVTTPEHIELSLEDDGAGFDPSQVPQERYGLVGIGERAKLLGGTMSVESTSGEGTRIKVRVPFPVDAADAEGDRT